MKSKFLTPKWIDFIIWVLIAIISIYAIVTKNDGRIFILVTILMILSIVVKFIFIRKDKR